jgi:hypothetical protein
MPSRGQARERGRHDWLVQSCLDFAGGIGACGVWEGNESLRLRPFRHWGPLGGPKERELPTNCYEQLLVVYEGTLLKLAKMLASN